MTFLLDTDTCISVLRLKPGYTERLAHEAPSNIAVSTVTVFELFCGIEKAARPESEREKVQRLVSMIHELPFDRAAATAAARIRMQLERTGQPIGPYDLLIAAQAVANDLTLVSNNGVEFRRVEGLRLISWP